MKEWKMEIISALEKQTKELREISFKDTVAKMGYNHIKSQDIREIAYSFTKRNPTYKAIHFVEKNSLFNGLVFSEIDYTDVYKEYEDKIKSYFKDNISKVKVDKNIVRFYLVDGTMIDNIDDIDIKERRKKSIIRFEYDFARMRMRYTRTEMGWCWTFWKPITNTEYDGTYDMDDMMQTQEESYYMVDGVVVDNIDYLDEEQKKSKTIIRYLYDWAEMRFRIAKMSKNGNWQWTQWRMIPEETVEEE